MTDCEVVSAITDNIETALKGLGLNFSRKGFEDPEGVPAGLLPMGQVFYLGEEFEDTLGGRPKYSDAGFLVKVTMAAREPAALIREQQRFTHSIRDALTVDSLNGGALMSEKSVSRVRIERAEVANRSSRSDLKIKAVVRYREP